MGKDLTEIAALLIGVALVALLVMNAGGTSAIIGTASQGFGGLLSTVEGQGNLGFASGFNSSFVMPQTYGMIP